MPRQNRSLVTPGLNRRQRMLLAATSYRSEVTVAAWWRREVVAPMCEETIAAAADALGFVRPEVQYGDLEVA